MSTMFGFTENTLRKLRRKPKPSDDKSLSKNSKLGQGRVSTVNRALPFTPAQPSLSLRRREGAPGRAFPWDPLE